MVMKADRRAVTAFLAAEDENRDDQEFVRRLELRSRYWRKPRAGRPPRKHSGRGFAADPHDADRLASRPGRNDRAAHATNWPALGRASRTPSAGRWRQSSQR